MLKLHLRFNTRLTNRIIAIVFICFLMQVEIQPSLGHPVDRESPVVKAVLKVSPAVVNISSSYEVRKRVNPFSGFGLDPFFENFFKDFFDPRFERRQQRTSLGSGVIIDGKRGFILTNAHVIERAGTIEVVLQDEREFEAQIIGADPDSDLAVLKIDSQEPLPVIEMGSSDDLMIGETVIAIGNPFGFSHTVTTGVISSVNRSVRAEDRVFHDFIQIDASINPGNSGGPLLNINGELIGINTAIYAKAQGIGFAIPISKAKKIISDLIQFGEVIQAWIGITVQNIDARLADYLNFPRKKAIMIKAVEPKSPAQSAGLEEGDIILSIGNKKIESVRDYWSAKKTYAAGDNLKTKIWRNGKIKTISVKTKVFPLTLAEELAFRLLGIKVEDLTTKNRLQYQIPARKGVVISEIDKKSYLANIGARSGDVIRRIDDYKIKDKEDFKKAIIKYRQKNSVVLLLQRGDQGYYITVNIGG
ncbi:MAG: Do family serine endopeptidase [Desulfobacterales bacterium]|nr:MAG: Do family serine endopeptidase [Desulfobacterales bacterium]